MLPNTAAHCFKKEFSSPSNLRICVFAFFAKNISNTQKWGICKDCRLPCHITIICSYCAAGAFFVAKAYNNATRKILLTILSFCIAHTYRTLLLYSPEKSSLASWQNMCYRAAQFCKSMQQQKEPVFFNIYSVSFLFWRQFDMQ